METTWGFKPRSVANTEAGESECDQSVLVVGMHQGIVIRLDQIKVVKGERVLKG
jgi:hypothetical protein